MALESAIRKAKCKRLMVIAIIDMIMEEEEDEVNIKKKRNVNAVSEISLDLTVNNLSLF